MCTRETVRDRARIERKRDRDWEREMCEREGGKRQKDRGERDTKKE